MKIKYEVVVEPDECPLEGNVMASGDDAADKAEESRVRRELKRGNMYAWCYVVVYARCGNFEGCDALGGVSVEREEDLAPFIADLKEGAKQSLFRNLEGVISDDLKNALLRVNDAVRVLSELRKGEL